MPDDEHLPATPAPDRLTLVRDVVLFQLKVLVDSGRDLLLVPLSLIAGLVSFFHSGERAGTAFYDLLRFGRRSERWINLFGATDKVHGTEDADDELPIGDIDRFAGQLEARVIAEYKSGGMSRQARERIERVIERLQRGRSRSSSSSDGGG